VSLANDLRISCKRPLTTLWSKASLGQSSSQERRPSAFVGSIGGLDGSLGHRSLVRSNSKAQQAERHNRDPHEQQQKPQPLPQRAGDPHTARLQDQPSEAG
jgi:hypothetical protein